MNTQAISTPLADLVARRLYEKFTIVGRDVDDIADEVQGVLDEQLPAMLGDNAAALYLDRITKALRILKGPSGMEAAVAMNRQRAGLPPQCPVCACAPDKHVDYSAGSSSTAERPAGGAL